MSNKSRDEMLVDLKSIKKPFIADVEFFPYCHSMDCKILTSQGGHDMGGFNGWIIGGPYRINQEEYNEAKRIIELGYKHDFEYYYDEDVSDEEVEQSQDISSDLSIAMFFVSHKLEFEKDYYIGWAIDIDEYSFFSSKEEIEDSLFYNSLDGIPERFIEWENMTDQELRSWHAYLSDRKLEQWEKWKGDDMSIHF